MNSISNGVIQVLDQLKANGQLNDYLIDDDERKWTKLVYDIMVNKFDMPFGNGTMQQASEIFNSVVRVWKGKNKLGNMMNMESKNVNKKLIRLTENDLHKIVKKSVKKAIKEGIFKSDEDDRLYWEPGINDKGYFEDDDFSIGDEGSNGWPNLIDRKTGKESGYQISGWNELPDDRRRYHVWNNIARNSNDFIPTNESRISRIIKESVNRILKETYGGFNQFSDGDFGSTGDPYGFLDDKREEDDLNFSAVYKIHGKYGVFVSDDGENSQIVIRTFYSHEDPIYIEGEKALHILDRARHNLRYYETYDEGITDRSKTQALGKTLTEKGII